MRFGLSGVRGGRRYTDVLRIRSQVGSLAALVGEGWELFAFPLRFALLDALTYTLTPPLNPLAIVDLLVDTSNMAVMLMEVAMEATTQVRQTRAWKAPCCNGARKLLKRLVLEFLPCCESLPTCLPTEKALGAGLRLDGGVGLPPAQGALSTAP